MRAMRRHRSLLAAAVTLALAAGAALVATAGSSAAPTKSQALFEKTLLDDPKTTDAVKNLLRGGGFVAPDIEFADLTGDGRSDAVVLVETGGVAGAVALYVLSTDGESAESDLRAVFRSQRLYRATVQTAGDTLTLRTPRYARGDDVCCPAKLAERVYVWSAGAKTMRRRSTRTVDGPGG